MLDTDLIYGIMSSLDMGEYSVDDLKYLTKPFNVSDSNLRTALSRMVKKETLTNRRAGRQAFYSRSRKGRALGSNVALRFSNPDWSGWDKSWWGVCFSISETDKEDRYRIRKKLVNFHFKPLYSGFWIRPCHRDQDMPELLDNEYIKKNARIIRFKPEIDFTSEFINGLWNLHGLNKGFTDGINLLRKHGKMISRNPEQAFVSMMTAGDKIVKILFADPLLPDCFMPGNWKAGILREEFGKFIKESRKASRSFWEKIFLEEKNENK